MDNGKIKALSAFTDTKPEDIKESGYGTYEIGDQEYLVLTDEEADKEAKDRISDELWAFNASFIIENSNIEWSERIENAIKKMQEELCEDANEIVKALIINLDEFVDNAISADGRGHFLSSYDGAENEEGEYYIYRQN